MIDSDGATLMNSDSAIDACMLQYQGLRHELWIFSDGVAKWFSQHPKMSSGDLPIVHSVKQRLKDPAHLAQKLRRKYSDQGTLTRAVQQLSSVVTDLSGVRVLHLHQAQFEVIHSLLMAKIEAGDWYLEDGSAVAYTWDPESVGFFQRIGLPCTLKESSYTSVHYVIRPKQGSNLVCEIQVRTLFEEVWGEVDHSLNYPERTDNLSCSEQLKVLAKLVGAGSRLLESIFKTKTDAAADIARL